MKTIKGIIKIFLQKFRQIIYNIFYRYYKKHYSVNPKKVLFLSSSRSTLSGNFEFINNELKNYDYEITYSLKKRITDRNSIKEKIRLTKDIATSKYILLDDFYPLIYAMKLRKETELIQVWHAMGAFKTFGYARAGKPGGPDCKSLTHKNYTGAIVSSEEIRKDYALGFGIDKSKIHATGIPRTDIFFDDAYIKNTKDRLYKKYPKLTNKKIILFAPTFRGNGQKKAYYNFSMIDFEKLRKEFSNEYVCILKMHPFINDLTDLPKNDNFYINMSDEREINDLLFITDVLITDYSSVIFEYSLLNKKLIFYVPDLEEYIESRSFFYSFDKYTYGTVAKNMNELVKEIRESKIDYKKLEEFKNYFCSACDGKATKKFINEMIIKK